MDDAVLWRGAGGSSMTSRAAHVHDVHATILYLMGIDYRMGIDYLMGIDHLMGIDQKKLTFRSSGRDFRLTDVSGKVIHDIIAQSLQS